MAEVSGRRRAVTVLILAAATIAVFFFAQPDWLISTSSSNDRAAQSNLTNAFTEADHQFELAGGTYLPVGPALLSRSAPEFDWITDGPTAGRGVPQNAVAVDSCAAGPACQVIVLAAYSRGTHTCWYAVESHLDMATASAIGFPGDGTFYGSRRDPQTCSTGTPGHPTRPPSGWQTSYVSAGPGG